jgi:CspA family cold shock protein
MKTATGIVKWFSNAKGYGFIMPDEGGEEIFAHFSAIEMDGYRTLKQGQKVEFQLQQGPKGWMAASIRPAGNGSSAIAGSVSVLQE